MERVLPMIRQVAMEQEMHITQAIRFRYRLAGHILGAAILELWVQGDTQSKKITFSGDLGRYDQPIMPDPASITETDILLVESTYGNRTNPYQHVLLDMARVINETFEAGGVVLIPSFAVGRTQELLYHLHTLIQKEAIPRVPVYVDSPMAISATRLYLHHSSYHKLGASVLEQGPDCVFDNDWIHYASTQEQSVAINQVKTNAIIISASGMATGGRILHHLYNRLGNPEDTLLFAGYQAEGSRGRYLLEGEESVRIFGIPVHVKCRIAKLNGLSAHADQTELRTWISGFRQSPKRTYIVHGEYEGARVLKEILEDEFGWNNVSVPDYLDSELLFSGI
ncbi:MAG: MBL fold metallo-hydrolase RNA specificity domain-containing protein [Sphingobacteriia bacterium]